MDDHELHDIVSNLTQIPSHVGIIMDGNRRWGQKTFNGALEAVHLGHKKGVDTLLNLLPLFSSSLVSRIKFVTVFAFSIENMSRSPKEVSGIFDLAFDQLFVDECKLHGIKLVVLGNRGNLPEKLVSAIESAEKSTAEFDKITLTVAFNYSGYWDIIEGCKKLFAPPIAKFEDIDENIVAQNLPSSFLPQIDFLIRTGGEKRISNFFLWHLAYSELYFTDILWPDFSVRSFVEALQEYNNRHRRFGL